MDEGEKKTLWQRLGAELSSFTSPVWLFVFLIGFNSFLFDVGTLITFNMGERLVEIPIPTLGRMAGIVILLVPLWSFIFRPIVGGIQRYTEGKLPTEEQPEEKQPKTALEKVAKYAKMLLPF